MLDLMERRREFFILQGRQVRSFTDPLTAPSSGWTGATWATDGSGAFTAPVPGPDLHEPNAGTFDVGSIGAWTPFSSNTVDNDSGQLRVTFVNSGNGASKFLRDNADLTANLALGSYYRWDSLHRVNNGSVGLVLSPDGSQEAMIFTITSTSLVTAFATFRCGSTSLAYVRYNGMDGTEIVWADDLQLRLLPFSDILRLRTELSATATVSARVTRTASTQAGLVLNYVDASNFLMVFLDGFGRLRVERFLAGTWASVSNVAATYVADAVLQATFNSDRTVSVNYNSGATTFTTAAQDAVFANGRTFGLLSTYNANRLRAFTYAAA